MAAMETLEQILRLHAKRYPQMEPQDAVKLIYQNVFGGGHLIRDVQLCRQRLEREYADTVRQSGMPLLEPIGNGMVRVMLGALEGSGYSLEQLGEDFIRSAREHGGSMAEFLGKLECLRQVTAAGVFGFSREELETYLAHYEEQGYPMVSHSGQYRRAYGPAYRVVVQRLLPEDIRRLT